MTDVDLGHVKIARKTFESDAWWLEERPLSRWEAWIDMIQLAQWTSRKITTTKFGTVILGRGEFVMSIRHMAQRWNWSIQSVRTFVKSAEFSTRIVAQRETQAGTVYLIVNYDKYQSTPERVNTGNGTNGNRRPTHLQHTSNTRTSSKAVKQEDLTTTSDSGVRTGASDQLGLVVDPPSDVQVVLDHYVAVHPRRRPGDADRKVVERALKRGYSPAELCAAIDGNATDEWHVAKKKHELSYVLRDNGKIDTFRESAAQSSADADRQIVDEFGCLTEYGELVTRP